MMQTTYAAYRFFKEEAGYCVGQRALGAYKLAKAEQEAKRLGLVASWRPDDDADLSWMDDSERAQSHDVEYCTLYKPCDCGHENHHEAVASLSGIVDADRNYRRVVEAELALEAIAHL